MSPEPLPCFVCNKVPEKVFPSAVFEFEELLPAQPYEATVFTSYGQYGSTVFDDMGRTYLEINICDPCMIERKDRVQHVEKISRPDKIVASERWVPHAPIPGGVPDA